MVARRHGGNHRDVPRRDRIAHDLGIHLEDLADEAEILRRGQLVRFQKRAVLPAETDCLAARVFEKLHEVLVDLAREHLLHDVHRLLVGVTHTVDKLAFLADLFQHPANLWTAAVHEHDVDTDELHQYDVVHHGFFQLGVDHRVAAVLDDDCLARPLADVRHRLHEDVRAVAVRYADFLFCTHVR